jgi:hypothetical protein
METMKKLATMILATVIAFSLSSAAFAKEKPAKQGKPAATGVENAETKASPQGQKGIENAETKQAAHKKSKTSKTKKSKSKKTAATTQPAPATTK